MVFVCIVSTLSKIVVMGQAVFFVLQKAINKEDNRHSVW